jgi:molybdopterin converting factor small subunit
MFPELKERVITSEGKVHEHYRIFVNGVYIDFAGGLERRLEDGDVIAVFPALAGGDS